MTESKFKETVQLLMKAQQRAVTEAETEDEKVNIIVSCNKVIEILLKNIDKEA